MSSLVKVLMARDDMSKEEAEDLVASARDLVNMGEDPEEVLLDMFGLEPDYIFDLL